VFKRAITGDISRESIGIKSNLAEIAGSGRGVKRAGIKKIYPTFLRFKTAKKRGMYNICYHYSLLKVH